MRSIFKVSTLVVGLATACGGSDVGSDPRTDETSATSVAIDGNAYQPEELSIVAGTEVRWVNQDRSTHTVTAEDGTFGSPELPDGGTFSHRFDDAGTFVYTCEIHPFMTATVRVG